MTMAPAQAVKVFEVGPRDGLQNEKTVISTADKLALIERAIDAGSRRIEVTSFVNPKKVPQMADAEAVCAGIARRRLAAALDLTRQIGEIGQPVILHQDQQPVFHEIERHDLRDFGPALLIAETCFDAAGKPVNYALDYHRGSHFTFSLVRK